MRAHPDHISISIYKRATVHRAQESSGMLFRPCCQAVTFQRRSITSASTSGTNDLSKVLVSLD